MREKITKIKFNSEIKEKDIIIVRTTSNKTLKIYEVTAKEKQDMPTKIWSNPQDKIITIMQSDIAELKADMIEVKSDIAELKADMIEVKSDIAELKADMAEVKITINKIFFTLEKLVEHHQ